VRSASTALSGPAQQFARVADALAIAVAVSLPWSSSATSILVLLLLLALVPVLAFRDVRREVATPAGGLPVALFALAALGTAWSDVSWAERLGGLDSFAKLLMIPFLLAHFRRSGRGRWVMLGYLVSCTALLALSSAFALSPGATLAFTKYFGVAVKDTATQSGQFVICAFVLLFLVIEMLRHGSRALAGGALALALIFFANVLSLASADLTIVPVATLVIIPILLVLLGFKEFSTRAMLAVLAAVATVVAASWIFSPSLRDLVGSTWASVQPYAGNDENPAGTRPEFWKKSLGFIRAAPLRGHGTGAIPDLFARSAVGQTGYSARLTTNPLQQTLAIGIQLGLVGIALLWAMWLSHLLLFRGNGLPEWVGLVIVTQNLVGSLLNSHLFDFTQGWIYVLGVGVAGGLVRQLRDVAN
jgi:O-antigen ligase